MQVLQFQKLFHPIIVSLIALPLEVTFLTLFSDLLQGGWRYKDTRFVRRSTP
jgi:hypothetical protein